MYLKSKLCDIHGRLLVESNREITPSVAERLRAIGKSRPSTQTLFKKAPQYKDFEAALNDSRYVTMFKPPVSKRDILSAVKNIDVEDDLLLELADMKRRLPYTYGHVLTVAAFVTKLSITYKAKNFRPETVFYCGFTHDIGKTRIPREILEKKERLTRREMAIIETHPVIGYLLSSYYLGKRLASCSRAGLEHHERLDGSGYPNGTKKLSIYTQLVSPIDIMDALMTKRPYRKGAYSMRSALDYLAEEARRNRLNKSVVLSLISYARKEKPDIKDMVISKKVRDPLPEELTHDRYK